MLRINTYISGCELIADASQSFVPPDTEFAYYLYRNNEPIVKRYQYTKDPVFRFSLEEPGLYFARVFARYKTAEDTEYQKLTANGNRVRFDGAQNLEAYRAFLRTEKEAVLPPLPFTKLEYPKQDFLVAIDRTKISSAFDGAMEALRASLSLEATRPVPGLIVLSELPLLQDGDRYALFSGMGRTDKQLIVGMNDVGSFDTANALSGQIGTFALMQLDRMLLTLETDYFGTEKLYYYLDSKVFFASTRVHLIVLAMQQLRVARYPNMTRIYAGLCHSIFVRQNFCQDLNIRGMLALRSDRRLCINLADQTILTEKTPLHGLLSTPVPYDELTYRTLLKRAADEIIDNLRIAMEHPAFDKFVLQVTGGMDSRAVLCALSRLPQYRYKVIAKTAKTAVTTDFDISMKLLSKFPLPFTGTPVKFGVSYHPNWKFESLSTQLGVTPEVEKYIFSEEQLPGDRVCVLPGAYGDFIRRYYAVPYFTSMAGDPAASDTTFFERLTEWTNKNPFVLFNAAEEIRRTFTQECMLLPGKSGLEKFENHYLFYRNGLHFNTSNNYHPFAPSWGILQSKTIIQLKCMTFSLNFGSRLELDLLYELNPELASIEFGDQAYNDLRKALDDQYHCYPSCQAFDDSAIAELVQDWETAAQDDARKRKLRPTEGTFINLCDDRTLFPLLYTLISRLKLRENVGSALYHYLKNGQNTKEYFNVIYKLYSLYYELF